MSETLDIVYEYVGKLRSEKVPEYCQTAFKHPYKCKEFKKRQWFVKAHNTLITDVNKKEATQFTLLLCFI